MLFRPQWETKTDPLTIEGLTAWLETKPADGAYDFTDCHGECLYGQYMASRGIGWQESSSVRFAPFRANVYANVAYEYPWTFGAALNRARGST